MPPKIEKAAKIAISIWAGAAIASMASGIGFPALLNYVHEIEYGCSESKIVNGIWIRPCMNSSARSFTAPLIYSYHATGPPYSIGLTVLDYADQTNGVCREIVVSDLQVTIDGARTPLLKSGERVTAPFLQYVKGATNTKADAYVDLGDLVSADQDAIIEIDATLEIHTDEGVIKESVSGMFGRGGWSGIWFIWEALFPHA